MTMTSVVSHNL